MIHALATLPTAACPMGRPQEIVERPGRAGSGRVVVVGGHGVSRGGTRSGGGPLVGRQTLHSQTTISEDPYVRFSRSARSALERASRKRVSRPALPVRRLGARSDDDRGPEPALFVPLRELARPRGGRESPVRLA
jgi:hypothetical protein